MATVPVSRQVPTSVDPTWQTVEVGERVLAGLLLIALAPPMAIVGGVIALLSRRTPLIAHRRVGWRGTTLWMVKLRTMWVRGNRPANAPTGWVEYIDDIAGPQLKRDADPRVGGWFAHFCRRHSIDEIPQLWHVLRGEMSLVGPRPVTDAEMRRHYGSDSLEVLQVKPGIAGLWQISGRNRLSYAERRALDLEFVRARSLSMYFRILRKTIPEIWNGSNSW